MIELFRVFHPKRFSTLFFSDVQNVARDPIMLMAMLPLLILPVLLLSLDTQLDQYGLQTFKIMNFSFYMIVFTLPLTSILMGWVTGMLLLEDRDDGPLMALDVTPIGKGGFLLYRAGVTACLTFLLSMVFCYLLLPERGALSVPLSVLFALEAVMISFILLAYPRNRVEGLALSKLINMAALVPFLALVPSPLAWLGGVVPTFWVGKILFADGAGLSLWAIAFVVHLGLLWWFYRRAIERAG